MPPGRPTVFNEKVCKLILEALEEGYDEQQACGYAGIGYRTYLRWKSEADKHVTKTDKKCFFEKVDSALSKREYVLESPIIDAIVKDKDVKSALRYKELRIRADIARAAKEAQLVDVPEIEFTEDDVEWLHHVSNYNK